MKSIPLILAIVFLAFWIRHEVVVDYEYNNGIGSYWSLGVKASTLQQKTVYLDQYVATLEAQHLGGTHDAVWLRTPDNGYDQNMVALKSLQGRMHQIQGMDEQSFAYQTAMQQITAQEQGEADHLTGTFEGCWYLHNYPGLWEWIDALVWFFWIIWLILGIIVVCIDWS
jgi:hypothetical protein